MAYNIDTFYTDTTVYHLAGRPVYWRHKRCSLGNANSRTTDDFDMAFCQLALKKGYLSRRLCKECLMAHAEIKRMGLKKPGFRDIVLSKAQMKPEQVAEIMALAGARSGKRVIEGYKLIKKISSGAFGSIYRAKQSNMDRTVAVKVLPRRLALNEIYVKNFMRETKLAARLTHENIVYVIDAGQSAGLLYIAMEFVEGESLHKVVVRRGPMGEREVLGIAWALAQALSHAHKLKILHRDIKPANIMMQRGEVPRLCDFGLAKSIARRAAMEASAIMGSPSYMAPEQILGERVDERTDIYGLGATLYTVATAELPFPMSKKFEEVYESHIKKPLVPLRAACPGASPLIERLVHKMMHRERERRFQSTDELISALMEIARGK